MRTRLLILGFIVLTGCKAEQPKSDYSDLDKRPAIERLADIKSNLSVPENATTAETLLYVMEVDISMKATLAIVGEQMVDIALASNPKTEENELKLAFQYTEEIMDEILPEIIVDIAKIYDSYFTEAELQDVIEFYSSDTGKKFVKNQSNLMQDSMRVSEKIVPIIQEKITEKMASRNK